jgi:hypothetical protein
MSITKAGLMCDVCGQFILPLFDEGFERFGVKGIDNELQCHIKCKESIIQAGTDWKNLPEGPLKKAFTDAVNKQNE